MAEVRKNKKVEKYDISEMMETKDISDKKVKEKKKDNSKSKTKVVKETKKKKSLWVRFRIFCNGVVSEFKKVHWPSKQDMVKYSVATIVFIIFLALYFYAIYALFAFVRTII